MSCSVITMLDIDSVSAYPDIKVGGRPKQNLSPEESKKAKRAIARQMYQKNSEKIKEAARIYKAANIDTIREKQRERYNRIKDRMKSERLVNKILKVDFSDEDKAKLLEKLSS